MIRYSAKSFDELATPLSRNKIVLLVEIADPDRAEQLDLLPLMAGGLGLAGAVDDMLEKTHDHNYLLAEAEISDKNKQASLAVIDYFRQSKIRDVVKAYLFIDEQLIENSRDGLPSMFDLLAQLPAPCYRLK